MEQNHSEILGNIPTHLREVFLARFNDLLDRFQREDWEAVGIKAGKLCEISYTILMGYVNGVYPASVSGPKNMVAAAKEIENKDSGLPRTIRILIPRLLIALYEIRNNRGIGHEKGEVSPNQMDATLLLAASKWLAAEFIRIFHNVDPTVASQAVEHVTSRTVPKIWTVNGRKRVLNSNYSVRDKTLLLAYSEAGPIGERDLFLWVESSNLSRFRRDTLRPLHKARLLEFEEPSRIVFISPLGIKYVEDRLLENF